MIFAAEVGRPPKSAYATIAHYAVYFCYGVECTRGGGGCRCTPAAAADEHEFHLTQLFHLFVTSRSIEDNKLNTTTFGGYLTLNV